MNGTSRNRICCRGIMGFAIGLTTLSLCVLAGAGQAADWTLVPDPASKPTKLSVPADLMIRFASGKSAFFGEAAYPSTPSPYALVGFGFACTQCELWNVAENKSAGKIPSKLDNAQNLAVSPDGKYLAAESNKDGGGAIQIWSFATGKVVKRIQVAKRRGRLAFVDFCGPDQIVTAATPEKAKQITVWNIQTGKAVREISEHVNYKGRQCITVSPGQKYLAFADNSAPKVTIHNLKEARPAVHVSYPNSKSGRKFGCEALVFSPDGSELAGIVKEQNEWRLVGWSLEDGQLAINLPLPASLSQAAGVSSYKGRRLKWLPDGSAWLLYGHALVDRNSGKYVWSIGLGSVVNSPARKLITNDHLLTVMAPKNAKQLQVVRLPWKQIDSALKALTTDEPAHLKPGQEVSLQIDVAQVRFGTPEKVKAELTAAMKQRLAANNLQVGEKKSTVLHVTYKEVDGRTLTKSTSPFPFAGRPFPFGPRIRRRGFPFRRRIPGATRKPNQNQNQNPKPSNPQPKDKPQGGLGTGFVIHSDGYLLTCAHVVEDQATVDVAIGEKKYKGKVISKDTSRDFALLQIEAKGLAVLPLSDSSKAQLGEEVRAVGFPLSTVLGKSIKVTRGTLAGFVERKGQKLFQVDASINPGNSGGPLVNGRGEVIGITSAKIVGTAVDNVGFCVPINDVKKMLAEKKIQFQTQGSKKKLEGPALVERVTSAVALITVGPDSAAPAPSKPKGPSVASPGGVRTTVINCQLAWKVAGHDKPVWTRQITVDPRTLVIRGEFSDASVRNTIFGMFKSKLTQTTIAFYISKDKDPLILPGVTQPTARTAPAPKKAKVGATKKATRRGKAKEGATKKATRRGQSE